MPNVFPADDWRRSLNGKVQNNPIWATYISRFTDIFRLVRKTCDPVCSRLGIQMLSKSATGWSTTYQYYIITFLGIKK